MNTSILWILAAGAVLMAATAWLVYPSSPSLDPGVAYKFMHCPKCRREVPFDPNKRVDGCKRCGDDFPLVPTVRSLKETGGAPGPYARLIAPLLIEANVLLAALLFVTRRRAAGPAGEVEYRTRRCRACKRRMRFAAAKVGLSGRCPRCKAELVFPEGETDEDAA